MFSAELFKTRAQELGFNLVGITRAEPSPMLGAYRRWIERGMHGTMAYMARPDRIQRREDPRIILPSAQTIIMVGVDYDTHMPWHDWLTDPSRGRIARYAWGLDYHDLIAPRLETLMSWLAQTSVRGFGHRVYVDTGAILERSHAQQAGMGFIGKNTMLIHPRRGSSFFLAEVLTSLECDAYDSPHRLTMCGTCTRCLAACPTDAFPQPYVLDARRCISYHTIENKTWIDHDLRPGFGNWVFGCDICQDVCPFQRFATTTTWNEFRPPAAYRVVPRLIDLLQLDDETFNAHYAGTPVARIRRERLVRNACIAAGNSADETLVPHLAALLQDPSPLIRGHAAWGLARLLGPASHRWLKALQNVENDPQVLAELDQIKAGR